MKTITVLVATGSLALAACGSSGYSSKTSGSTAPASSSKTTSSSSGGGGYGSGGGSSSGTKRVSGSSAASAGGKAITIAMHDNFFGTKVISGKPGSTVKVTLKNDGSNEHNFKIDGQKLADADVQPGKTGAATVKIPTSGSIQFYCEYHKGLGMVGTVKPA
jgi:plastocyanin